MCSCILDAERYFLVWWPEENKTSSFRSVIYWKELLQLWGSRVLCHMGRRRIVEPSPPLVGFYLHNIVIMLTNINSEQMALGMLYRINSVVARK